MHRLRRASALSCLAVILAMAGCDSGDSATSTATPAAKAGYVVGRVTMADGKPITTAGAKYNLGIEGVSDAGEKVSFGPGVKADGTFSQKVPPGSYQMRYGKISVPYGGEEFSFDLEPQGDAYTTTRDAAEGITQDFVWRVTGPKQMYARGKLDPGNHTHWNGMNLGMRFASYREDLKSAPPVVPPAGTKLSFTLTPVEGKKAIDGSELKVVTFEREWRPNDVMPNDDLNDFLPGDYAITGVANFPDGTAKPIVFQGKGDYPNYVSTGRVTLEKDGLLGGMWKQPMSWGIN